MKKVPLETTTQEEVYNMLGTPVRTMKFNDKDIWVYIDGESQSGGSLEYDYEFKEGKLYDVRFHGAYNYKASARKLQKK